MRYQNVMPAYLGHVNMKLPAWKGGFNLGLRGGDYKAMVAMTVAQFEKLPQEQAESLTENAVAGWETGHRRHLARQR